MVKILPGNDRDNEERDDFQFILPPSFWSFATGGVSATVMEAEGGNRAWRIESIVYSAKIANIRLTPVQFRHPSPP
ncbi:hypothetical protein GCM10027295_33100 [Pseudaeromonas pectinilytica]